MLFAHFDGQNSQPSLIACQANGDADILFWSSTSGSIATGSSLSGVSSDAIVGDFDGDQDLDILASTPNGHRSFTNNQGLGWDGDSHNRLITLTNATILDYDLDSSGHLLIPNVGTVDGNPATMTGNITAYGFQSGNNYDNRVETNPLKCSSRGRPLGRFTLAIWTATVPLNNSSLRAKAVNTVCSSPPTTASATILTETALLMLKQEGMQATAATGCPP